MKTCVRIGSLVIALGLAGLLAGCASRQPSSYRKQPARDFEVVETSSKRQLSDREMEYLRAKVVEYLAQQGQTGTGDYFVKIYLGEDDGTEKGDWVVVRFSRFPSTRFELMTAYGTTSYPRYPRYSYDFHPFGSFGFGSLAYRYYDDPYYYGYTGRYPTWYNRRDRDQKKDHNDHDDNQPHHGNRPSGALKPSYIPTSTAAERPRSNGAPSFSDERRRSDRGDATTTRDDGHSRWRGRQPEGNSGMPINRFVPANTPPSDPVAPRYRPPTRSDLHGERVESGRYQARPARSSESRSPGGGNRDYSAPAPSSEPSYQSRSSESSSSSRTESSSNFSSSSNNSSSSSDSQPATRSMLHDGGRTARGK